MIWLCSDSFLKRTKWQIKIYGLLNDYTISEGLLLAYPYYMKPLAFEVMMDYTYCQFLVIVLTMENCAKNGVEFGELEKWRKSTETHPSRMIRQK